MPENNRFFLFPKTLMLSCLVASAAAAGNAAAAQDSATQELAEEVRVTATRQSRAPDDIAGTVSLITAADIQQTIAEDLDDLVRYMPGISMSTSARGGNEGFSIRGIGGNRILTLIDGVRSNDFYAAGPASYGKDNFELDDLKAVEIIRGPASALYGADAMGGAVILRSKSAEDYLRGEDAYLGLRGSYNGVNDMTKAGLTAVRRLDKLTAMVQYTRRDFGEAEINGDGALNPQDASNDALLLELGWRHHDKLRSSLTLDMYRGIIDTDLRNEVSDSVQSSIGRDETDRYRLSLETLWAPGSALFDQLQSRLYWQKTDALQNTVQTLTSYSFINPMNPASFAGTDARRETDFIFLQETAGIDVSLYKDLQLGALDHALVYGFTLEQTDTERPRDRCDTALGSGATTCAIAAYPFAPPEVFPNKTFPDTDVLRGGVYIQDEIVLGDSGLTLVPGIRYDRYEMDASDAGLQEVQDFGYVISDVEHNEVTLNLGALYDLSDNASLFLQYAEGFRPPNFSEANQSFVNLGFGYAVVPNPDLEPETSRNLELGLRTQFGNTGLNVAVYNNDYEDFIQTGFVGMENGISLFQEQNIAEVNIYGAEVQVNHAFNDQWQAHGSLAWSRGDNEEAGTALNSVEPLTSVLGLRYQAPDGRWSLESLFTLVAEKDRVAAADDVTADSYEVVDLVGSFNLSDRTVLRLGVFNLFDEEYARWANIFSLSASDNEQIEQAREPGTAVRLSFSHQL